MSEADRMLLKQDLICPTCRKGSGQDYLVTQYCDPNNIIWETVVCSSLHWSYCRIDTHSFLSALLKNIRRIFSWISSISSRPNFDFSHIVAIVANCVSILSQKWKHIPLSPLLTGQFYLGASCPIQWKYWIFKTNILW